MNDQSIQDRKRLESRREKHPKVATNLDDLILWLVFASIWNEIVSRQLYLTTTKQKSPNFLSLKKSRLYNVNLPPFKD